MLLNYLKIAYRHLMRNKIIAFIQVAGLSVGLACVILVGLYVWHEFTYDQHNRHADRIYRLTLTLNTGDEAEKEMARCPSPLAPTLQANFPRSIESTVRFFNYWGLGFNIQSEDHVFREVNFAFADSTVFEIFDFEFSAGQAETALDGPGRVVITETAARKYFPHRDPLGKIIRVNNGYDLQVTGIVEDWPSNSHFHFNFLASYSTLRTLPWRRSLSDWHDDFCYAYVLLTPETKPADFEHQIAAFGEQFLPSRNQHNSQPGLQPLRSIHLDSHLGEELEPGGNRRACFILISIALFILTVAILNAVNLTTARASTRIKEIGMRKLFGSQRVHLIGQFFSESLLINFFALLIAGVLVELALPTMGRLTGVAVTLPNVLEPAALVALIGVLLVTSMLASLYPAFFLSRAKPLAFLKGSLLVGSRGHGRQLFVGIQLAIAMFLMIATLVIRQQLQHIQAFDTGFRRQDIVVLPVNQTEIAGSHYDAFITKITADPAIEQASGIRTIAGYEYIAEGFASVDNAAIGGEQMVPFLLVRQHFTETFDLQLVAGRDFSPDVATDGNRAILVNDAFVRHYGWQRDEALDREFVHRGWGRLHIVGVVTDFNFESLHEPIKPLILKLIWPHRQHALTDYLAVRIAPGQHAAAIAALERAWYQFAPNDAFQYDDLDAWLTRFYGDEQMLGHVAGALAVIALLISVLGILGLISFVVRQRTKEIAIRKVLGASVGRVMGLVSVEIVVTGLIAAIVAWPVAYLAAAHWLNNFAYRVALSGSVFVLATVIVLLVTFSSVWIEAYLAAVTNPVDALRDE